MHVKSELRICMTGHVIECVTSLNTSNSTKTKVDTSYIPDFLFPSHKPRPQRTSGSRDYHQLWTMEPAKDLILVHTRPRYENYRHLVALRIF